MFRDYDGAGGSFGDTGFTASTSDVVKRLRGLPAMLWER